ncbi:glutamic acid-rich protein [Cydia strobilella]|uniref:glutamic acid-rich protein n=1 Tax=Cydia strobilella TaxID=1100964 RepID=UPI003005E2F7
MNRMRKHRIKEEKATTSSSSRKQEEQDLAYFIHDRVELMHQVFSVLKSKELKSLAPECVRRLSIDDLQELCLEELLGISSKRLCAILDGAEPPSDTDSSSQSAEQLETISLDSISSDDEILSQASKKKKHKHRHSKKKRRKKSKSGDEGESRASRAGLTVLELLELQARARAIRAQLHQEPTKTAEPAAEPASSDNDEVLIKEEPAEVVEISSDEEKPDVKRLDQQIGTTTSQSNESETNNKNGDSKTVTKRINDLVITVPQSKPTRRIKLKRKKPTETVTKETTSNKVAEKEKVDSSNTLNSTVVSTISNVKHTETEPNKASNVEAKSRSKKSKKKKKKVKEKEGSDEDEITIQLSDTEKMDLLEDLDAKNFDTVSSSDSDSSETSEDSENENQHDEKQNDTEKQAIEKQSEADNLENNKNNDTERDIAAEPEGKGDSKKDEEIRGYVSNDNVLTVEINDLPVINDDITTSNDNKREESSNAIVDKQIGEKCDDNDQRAQDLSKEKTDDANNKQNNDKMEKTDECANIEKSDDKAESSSCLETKSDGEISDRESSEVEASDVQPEVVCISDDEQKKKKKKKKDKKSKKEKKKSGFREQTDENFYKDKDVKDKEIPTVIETIDEDDDDVYEYLEISDDSSCYEVEGVSVLSKEPTAEEIEAFSARMDEIDLEKDETVIPIPNENIETENDTNDLENVSWKDRYLGSKKVKRVLTTSNILNAIKRKNKELKKKLEEAKKAELAEKEAQEEKEDDKPTVEDGTIEQYETLLGSTKYVDPVKEIDTTESKDTQNKEDSGNKDNLNKEDESENVTKEMKKDAKQLLKMYKRLLKYNDITKQKDPNKKKKKKQKKNKDKEKEKVA